MARIRSIHPGFFTDEDLVTVSMGARLLFLGLGVEADDKGIFEWKPLTIKMKVFPADNVDVVDLLSELEGAGAVLKFQNDGRSYGAIRNFRKFQRPKTPNDVHPITDEIRNYVGLTTAISETPPQKEENAPQMEEGGEGMKEKTPPTPPAGGRDRGSKISDDWIPPAVADLSPQARALALQWPAAAYAAEGEAFRNYWLAETGAKARKADWGRTWANRVVQIHSKIMRDVKFGNAPKSAPAAKSDQPRSPEAQRAHHLKMAEFYDGIGNDIEAREHRRKAQGPPGDRLRSAEPIGNLIRLPSATAA